ncbi:MAG TPA: ATP-binding cassette domain-containing protein [Bacteroidales bacterium]|nr:ATP-binding cassette domain-containing protein [Bacteroidales bacterium]HOK74727.1 ATP-binding cassette domain-containing protein [Bacteroidales bacterium]HOM40431.1 ATP-binding cassette domain-containing protein [Bacteroidales bacterium]HOU29872.1 ATP-binding cassette domain-containing protein [Bacteroidales bacterium]HPP93151.1 ATP-binding cassette domain-containing protein [Bacteroidales bacterium]
MKKLVELIDVTAGYNSKVVLEDVNLTVYEEDFIGIIGPNGGGKTTLLKVILGMVKPMKGTVIYNHEMLKRTDIGYLPQLSSVDISFPLTVTDVILSGLMMHKGVYVKMNREDRKKADGIIDEMGLKGFEKATLAELSGGQIQRVFLGRALIGNPRLLLLDEPDNFVDTTFENEFYIKLHELNSRMAILMASHDVGTISYHVKSYACVNRHLHYHPSPELTEEQLSAYNCPIQLVTHGPVPHTVLKKHD